MVIAVVGNIAIFAIPISIWAVILLLGVAAFRKNDQVLSTRVWSILHGLDSITTEISYHQMFWIWSLEKVIYEHIRKDLLREGRYAHPFPAVYKEMPAFDVKRAMRAASVNQDCYREDLNGMYCTNEEWWGMLCAHFELDEIKSPWATAAYRALDDHYKEL